MAEKGALAGNFEAVGVAVAPDMAEPVGVVVA